LKLARGDTDEMPARDGEPAYTSLDFRFDYTQTFFEKGKTPKLNKINQID
jgi:hypothetical protein